MSDAETQFEQDESSSGNPNAWMMTFADLLSLIITFFVMLFSTTSIKKPEWEQITHSLSQRLNPEKDTLTTQPAAEISIEKEVTKSAQNLGYLHGIFTSKISATPQKDKVLLQQQGDRLIISIVGNESFQRGSTQMTPELEAVVSVIGDLTHHLHNRIEIHGNADSDPVSGKRFPSNWELSLARALTVGEMIRDHGYPYRMSIYGRGDSAYKYLPEHLSTSDRERIARRIDIVIREERAEPRP